MVVASLRMFPTSPSPPSRAWRTDMESEKITTSPGATVLSVKSLQIVSRVFSIAILSAS